VRTPGVVEIREGIQVGDQVVVGGSERLTPGAEVRPTVQERSANSRRGGPESDSARGARRPDSSKTGKAPGS